jgi:DNA-binding response OmpR family regulator
MWSSQALERKHVLIIEDEFLLGLSLQEDLAAAGAEVTGPVSTVREALDIVASEAFDLALLDVNIRGEMSFSVAEALLERNVPFVFLTGYDSDVLPEQLRRLPRLSKPYDPKELASALCDAVQGWRPRQAPAVIAEAAPGS